MIWEVDYLPNHNGFKTQTYPHILPLDTIVQTLIDPNTKSQNHTLVDQIFLHFEVEQIKAISLSFRGPNDRLIWHISRDGHYEVKFGCHLAFSCNYNQDSSSSSSGLSGVNWNKVWQVHISLKIKHFAQKAVSNNLPVKINLSRRRIDLDVECNLYGLVPKSVEHVLRDCGQSSRL